MAMALVGFPIGDFFIHLHLATPRQRALPRCITRAFGVDGEQRHEPFEIGRRTGRTRGGVGSTNESLELHSASPAAVS